MKNVFTYHFILGIFLLLSGMSLFLGLPSPIRNLGIVLMVLAYVYLARIFYSKFHHPDNEHFRSRVRDEILKNLLKR
jgi:uncharacterized membrane protein